MTVAACSRFRAVWAFVKPSRWWPFDRRDMLLMVSLSALGGGLGGWDWRIAGVVLGVLGLALWALPLMRRAG